MIAVELSPEEIETILEDCCTELECTHTAPICDTVADCPVEHFENYVRNTRLRQRLIKKLRPLVEE